jgi:D-alanyl-D-alanine carboxypeptidase/D-alanyl-D-alanine-endopeptidase (penicillin-binding protein 4)
MLRTALLFPFILYFTVTSAQQNAIERFLSDSSMIHAFVSLYIIDADNGKVIAEHNPDKSLTQASVMKLVTTAAALEMLGPDYTFKTIIGYSGSIKKGSKTLDGNIIIKGGGDPALGSENFPEYYRSFIEKWVEEISKLGIKRITGRVLTDDSYYDYQPVPAKWNWEDMGNYYGAGVYGLSLFDNTLKIHFRTSGEGSTPVMTDVQPSGSGMEFDNYLKAHGSTDEGYVFSAPYNNKGWIAGSIPVDREDFVLKASISDPPLFIADILDRRLKGAGIQIDNIPATTRLHPELISNRISVVAEIFSPPLDSIIKVLNHESINLYAENLVKELGRVFKGKGSTSAGTEVVLEFLKSAGIKTDGMFIEDGSGLSAQDAINSRGLTMLLWHMKKNGKHFGDYYTSLPDAGIDGTLKNYFKDPLFDSRMKAKSGTMLGVKSYAGYFTTLSGKEMIFCIIANNFTGSSTKIISHIEEIIKEIILYK